MHSKPALWCLVHEKKKHKKFHQTELILILFCHLLYFFPFSVHVYVDMCVCMGWGWGPAQTEA